LWLVDILGLIVKTADVDKAVDVGTAAGGKAAV
jgi:hypothetical protein